MSICCTPTSAESGPGGRRRLSWKRPPRTRFSEARCPGAAGRGGLCVLPARFPSGRDSFPLSLAMKKQKKKNSSQPSLCSLTAVVFSPSQAGDFLQGSDAVQAAPTLGRSPLRAGQHDAPHPANTSLAPAEWHKPSLPSWPSSSLRQQPRQT